MIGGVNGQQRNKNRHLHEHIRKFMQGNISEDEFVEQYNRLVEQEAENTQNRLNHMSIFKRRENEVY